MKFNGVDFDTYYVDENMKCKKCPYLANHIIPVINKSHPTYYEDVVYCGLSMEYELTTEDLKIKCPLKKEM